jgi:hypothetical protein
MTGWMYFFNPALMSAPKKDTSLLLVSLFYNDCGGVSNITRDTAITFYELPF